MHSREKPKQCPICFKRFRHASQLSAHKKLHHTSEEIEILSNSGLNLAKLILLHKNYISQPLNPNLSNVRIELAPIIEKPSDENS